MPYDTSKLPAPPEFPASNASYNSIVGKMHKAAQNATTKAAAIAAVTMIKNHIGGVNTYAKATRRYADALIEALGGGEKKAADKPAIALADKTPDPKAKPAKKAGAAKAKKLVKRGALA